jgi:plasmid stabilization system protein ParE
MTVDEPIRVRWLITALKEVDAVVARIQQDSEAAAERFRRNVFERTALLAFHPRSGGIHPVFPKARFLIEDSYLILYTVHRKEVVIRAVVHGAMLFRKKWIRRNV